MGRNGETPWRPMRRLLAGFASRRSGRPGSAQTSLRRLRKRKGYAASTTGGCLEWLDERRMKAGESLRDKGGRNASRPAPEARPRGEKSPPMARRKAAAGDGLCLRRLRRLVCARAASSECPRLSARHSPSHTQVGEGRWKEGEPRASKNRDDGAWLFDIHTWCRPRAGATHDLKSLTETRAQIFCCSLL
jgi:hypothetical protein